jgi:ABC-type phosphate/phosphonate transport system substrate-binding protein
MGRGPIVLIAAVVAALLVAGCGGGSDDSSSSANSPSKKEFTVKADAICQKASERMQAQLFKVLRKDKVNGKLKKPSLADNKKFIVAVLIPSLKQEISELKALGAPEGDEERVDAIVEALEEGLETAEGNPEAVAAGSSDMVFGIASRLAGEYGLQVCGSR